MQTTQQIIQLLRIAPLHYQMLQDAFFEQWCKCLALRTGQDFSTLRGNDALQNFYHKMWYTQVEAGVLSDLQSYPLEVISPQDVANFIAVRERKIRLLRPRNLIQILKINNYGKNSTSGQMGK